MLIARDLNIIGAQSLKVNKLEVGAHPLELSRSVESTWFLRFFLQVTAGL